MQHFPWQVQRGSYLLLFWLLFGNQLMPAQTEPCTETGKCERFGDICLSCTARSVASEVCFKLYEKKCSNDETNCAWVYREDKNNKRCVIGLIQQLGAISAADRCGSRAAEALLLRQEINDLIVTASLEVDGFTSEIDSEVGQIRAVHDDLSDKRDDAVSESALGSAVGTGGGAAGSALALASKTATAGSWVGAIFGGVGAIFGFRGWYQQPRGPKGCFPSPPGVQTKKCQISAQVRKEDLCPSASPTPSPNCSPTMLSHLVFPGSSLDSYATFHSGYDLAIDNYLTENNRGQNLIQHWLDQARQEKTRKVSDDYKSLASSKNYALVSTEPFLFTSNSHPGKVSIDDLAKRSDKLVDLRSVVARMNRDLSRLTENLAQELTCPTGGSNAQ